MDSSYVELGFFGVRYRILQQGVHWVAIVQDEWQSLPSSIGDALAEVQCYIASQEIANSKQLCCLHGISGEALAISESAILAFGDFLGKNVYSYSSVGLETERSLRQKGTFEGDAILFSPQWGTFYRGALRSRKLTPKLIQSNFTPDREICPHQDRIPFFRGNNGIPFWGD